MTLLEVVVLSIIEGITEFLPISSTFHLLFSSQVLGIQFDHFLQTFVIAIQGGAILAVLSLFGKELLRTPKLVGMLSLSFLATSIVGFVVYKLFSQEVFANQYLMIGVFMTVGLVFILYELWLRKRKITLSKSMTALTPKHAVLVGLLQTLAFVPGVSRSGAVILTMMQLGYTRSDSAKFSFLLAVPTILAASLYSLWDGQASVMEESNGWLIILTGAGVAFIAAYLSLRFLIRYLQTHSLIVFGVYRLVMGLLLFLWLWVK